MTLIEFGLFIFILTVLVVALIAISMCKELRAELNYQKRAKEADYSWHTDRHWGLARQIQLLYEFLDVKEKTEPKKLVKND